MTITEAKRQLEVSRLRVLAANQRIGANAYRRQAEHPIYPGQEEICLGKADVQDAIAARTEAEANLVEVDIK